MNFKKILLILAFVLSVFTVSAYAKTMQFTMGDYNAKVDDGAVEVHTMEVAPYTVEGRTMVPVRIISETFGADVQYIHEESKVVITSGDKIISLIIGQASATVNGEVVAMDVPSVETNGRTLVPLRFVSENLGFDVEYLGSTEQILITNDPAVIELNGAKISLADYEAMYKLNVAKYGSTATEEEIAEYTNMVLLQYAMYEAEAAKWEITLDPMFYSSIKSDAEQFTVFEDVLDASWISLLENDYRASYLTNFLKLVYAPDEETAEKYYNENYFAAKHILVSDEATANDILAQLKKGADFDKLMNEYTEDPGVITNPDGYVFTTGKMVAEFENATKELAVGKMSGIVESDYGYHIIKRIALPAYSEADYESVSDAYSDEKVAEHYNSIAELAEIKNDAYTTEQLMELCK